MSSATRRLWLRRWNRFGYVLFYPLIRAVHWVKTCRKDLGALIWYAIILAVVFGIPYAIVRELHNNQPASFTQLRDAVSKDSCFAQTMPKRMAQWNRAVKKSDVTDLQNDCKEMWENLTIQQEQLKALK